MTRGRSWRIASVVACVAMLTGCDTWLGESEEPPLPGSRIPVIVYDGALQPDPRVTGIAVALPAPYRNANWAQAGGGPLHALGHVEAPNVLGKPAWTVDIGAGAGWYRPMLSEPVAAGGRVYTMDSKATISAYDAADGKRLWRTGFAAPSRDSEAFGGGIAFDGGRIYAVTGFSEVGAFDAETGKLLWRQPIAGPVRGAPLVMGAQIFVVTVDNETVALAADTGAVQWQHAGFAEPAALIGAASAAGIEGTVVSPYSSGEIFALNAASGRANWSDNLAAVRRQDATSSLADIRALPVTDGSLVYAVSHSGRTEAIDLRTGARAWERNIGGVNTPWIGGDWLFILGNENQLACLGRRDGRVRWVVQIDRFEDEKAHKGPVRWIGPLLLSNRLVLIGRHGQGIAVDPADGTVAERFKVPKNIMSAIVADGTLYLQTDNAKLMAYR